ncbi:MAG: hypothetical protein LBJ69_02345 [Holosporales bacterium]|jgi:hypothetical protein|nr:hypothetical protein [Holosporales bacterium]
MPKMLYNLERALITYIHNVAWKGNKMMKAAIGAVLVMACYGGIADGMRFSGQPLGRRPRGEGWAHHPRRSVGPRHKHGPAAAPMMYERLHCVALTRVVVCMQHFCKMIQKSAAIVVILV